MPDTSDLPERLRAAEDRCCAGECVSPAILLDAAARIEELQRFVQLVADRTKDQALLVAARKLGAF